MKQFLKAILAAAFLTIGVWAFAAKPAIYTAAIGQSVQKINRQSANKLYLQNCARCHGADGKSETTIGKSLFATDLTGDKVKRMNRQKISDVIAHGKDEMPAFGKKLSKPQIKSLIEFVRRF